MKKFSMLLLLIAVLSTVTVCGAEKTRYVYNGTEVNISSEAVFKDGKIFVPAAEVFKLTKVKVIENKSNNSITVEALGKPGYASAWLNSKKGRMNGQNINLSAQTFKQNGIFYVPSDFVAEQIGVDIKYDKDKNTIYIDTVKEGKITSTANLNTAPKKTSSTSSSTSSSKTNSGGTSAKTSNTSASYPDFTAVTGIKSIGTNPIYGKEYQNVSKSDYDKYVSSLLSYGYQPVIDRPIKGDILYGYVEDHIFVKNYIFNIRISVKPQSNSKYTIAISDV